MARVAFPLVLQSPVTGSALVGATATITKHVVGGSLGSGAEAEIFTTETESTKVSGSKIATDNTGRWTQGEAASPAYAQYWLPQGTYDILISGTGLKSVYITRELGSAAIALRAETAESITSAKTVVATEQSRESGVFGTLPTPDEVTVVLPENGLIAVAYHATWETSTVAARAAIFIGTSQLKVPTAKYEPPVSQAAVTGNHGTVGIFSSLTSCPIGLISSNRESGYGGDIATGQALALIGSGEGMGEELVVELNTVITPIAVLGQSVAMGGVCYIFASAGTHKISVQFKTTTGKVTARNRELWAWVVA